MAGLGTTLRVRMDDSAVRRGIAGIQSRFARLGGAIRGGIGRLRSAAGIGGGLSVLGLGFLTARGLRDIAQAGSDLSDLSAQTRTSVKDLVELKEALRLAGFDASQTGHAFGTFQKNIATAIREGGRLRDVFRELNLNPADLQAIGPVNAFGEVMRALNAANNRDPAFANLAASDLFGARRGFKLLTFAAEFEKSMAKARENMKTFAPLMDRMAPSLDTAADDFDTIARLWRELMLRIASTGVIEKFGNMLAALDFQAIADSIKEFFDNPITGMRNIQARLTQFLGEVLANAFQWAVDNFDWSQIGKQILPDWLGKLVPDKTASAGEGTIPGKIDRTNRLLESLTAIPGRYG